jgi:uncharacterized protein YggT (Ycf19 family)
MAVIARRGYRDRAVRDDGVADTGVVAADGLMTWQVVLARLIWLATGIILILLAFRFIFALLGANPNNGFANFIYSTSHPFVAPFFGLFHYNVVNLGASRFEVYTLVAMAIYAVIGWLLTRLATLNRRF